MKYIQIATVLLVALFLTVFTSCSPDMVEEEALDEIDDEVAEILPPEPVPAWDDGVITITVGRFEDGQQMLNEIKKSYSTWRYLEERFEWIPLTPKEKQYTVDIEVLFLKEIGFNKPATIEEIEERFRELGYRPITPEEAMEIRLHLPDQPDSSTRHRMSAFLTLPAEHQHHEKIGNTLKKWTAKGGYSIVSVAYKGGQGLLERWASGYSNGAIRTIDIALGPLGGNLGTLGGNVGKINPNDRNCEGMFTSVAGRSIGRHPDLGDLEIDYGNQPGEYPPVRFAAAIVGSKRRVRTQE